MIPQCVAILVTILYVDHNVVCVRKVRVMLKRERERETERERERET